MNYASYSNEELRRVLLANPKDAEAIVEAADRFVSDHCDQTEIEAAESRGYTLGYGEGYEAGRAEGLEIGLGDYDD
jgi:flagellar biosynthesis/type III secretory pathway protein FliH